MPKKLAVSSLLIIVFTTVLLSWFTKDLKFNYDFETYFPQGDSSHSYLIDFRNKFENDADYFLIGIENKQGIYNSEFLSRIDSFTNELKSTPCIRKVTGPTQLINPVYNSFAAFEIPVLHFSDPEKLKQDSVLISKTNEYDAFISKSGKAVNIYVKTKSDIKKAEGDALLLNVEKLINKYQFEGVHFAGKIKASYVYVALMQKELAVFMAASAFLISLFLFIAYRSAWGIIFPVITVLLSIAWTLGVMSLLGKNLDLLTMLLPPILFVVAMSDMTHFLSHYLEELRNGNTKLDALMHALKDVGIATFITALTTSVGFLTLLNSKIVPIREFGIYTSIGVFIAYLMAFTFLPAVLVLLPKPKIAATRNEDHIWQKVLHRGLIKIFQNRKLIIGTSSVIIVLCLMLIPFMKVNSTLLDDLSDSDPLKKDVLFLENEFGGVRPVELVVKVKHPDKKIFDKEVLKELDKLEHYLINTYHATGLVSPVSVAKTVNKAFSGGAPEEYKLPDDEGFGRIFKKLQLVEKRKELSGYISPDKKEARFSGRIKDEGSSRIKEKNLALEAFFKENIDKNLLEMTLTGSSLLVDKNNEYLAGSLIEDLFIGVLTIALIIGLLFQSTRMVILAIIPNLLPLGVIAAIMVIFDIHLKASTSIIFSIAFGIAVDDSIHFLSRLKLELKEKSFLYALKRTYISTGKAMVITSLILISGFLTLLLSDFQSTFYTGLLISLTLAVAIIADLVLLPVLLLIFYKKK